MFSLCDNYKSTQRQCSHRSWIFLTPSYDNRTKEIHWRILYSDTTRLLLQCKVQPRHASFSYPFCNTAAHMEATPTREGI